MLGLWVDDSCVVKISRLALAHPLSLWSFPPPICLFPMSDWDQPSEDESNEEEMREIQRRRLALLSSATAVFAACQAVVKLLTPIDRTPYHTSALSGEQWVQELLSGHPRRIRTELGVY